jgi:hypothetical protein
LNATLREEHSSSRLDIDDVVHALGVHNQGVLPLSLEEIVGDEVKEHALG